jgi:hypothetical protein
MSREDATLRRALAGGLRTFLRILLGKELVIMPEMKVGDPPATLRAVESARGVNVPIAGGLSWGIAPSEGTLAELAPGASPDTILLIAKAEGTVTVTVADPAFSLSAILDVAILPAPPPTPDKIEIEFEAGS